MLGNPLSAWTLAERVVGALTNNDEVKALSPAPGAGSILLRESPGRFVVVKEWVTLLTEGIYSEHRQSTGVHIHLYTRCRGSTLGAV